MRKIILFYSSSSDGLVEHFTIIITLSLIMGVPWILELISAGLQYSLGSQIFSVRVALDYINLLSVSQPSLDGSSKINFKISREF